jgi:hypothetical protein
VAIQFLIKSKEARESFQVRRQIPAFPIPATASRTDLSLMEAL